MARKAGGAWRLHPDLACVTADLQKHAARRVQLLQPTPDGRYEFSRANQSSDPLGRPVFDLFVRFTPTTQGETHDQ